MNDSLDHEEFVRGYREGGLEVEVDDERASKLITEGGMGDALKINALVWGGAWLVSLIGGAVMALVHSWWWLVLIGVGLVLPQGLKRINKRAVLQASLEDESFYRNALEFGVVILRRGGE